MYAGSYVVTERLGMMKSKKEQKKDKRPYWQRRLEESISRWRKDLGRIEELRKGVDVSKKIRDELERRYQFTDKGAVAVCTMLRDKIRSGSAQIKNSFGRGIAARQNNLFRNNQSRLYKELGGTLRANSEEKPDAEETRKFWSGIWSEDKQHRKEASWLSDVKEKLSGVAQMEDVVVSLTVVKEGVRKMANWKAPGPDQVRGFWFKRFQSLHVPIAHALQKVVEVGEVPEWLVKGRTVLLQKDAAKGTVVSNYRPIA